MQQARLIDLKTHGHGMHKAWNIFMRDDNPPVRDNHFFDYAFPKQDLWRRRRTTRKEGQDGQDEQDETRSNTVFHVDTVLMRARGDIRDTDCSVLTPHASITCAHCALIAWLKTQSETESYLSGLK